VFYNYTCGVCVVGCNENQNDPCLTKINSNSRVNNCELGILPNVKLNELNDE